MDPIEPESIRGMSGDDDDAAGVLLSPLSLVTAALLLIVDSCNNPEKAAPGGGRRTLLASRAFGTGVNFEDLDTCETFLSFSNTRRRLRTTPNTPLQLINTNINTDSR